MHRLLGWLYAESALPTVGSLESFYAHNEARSVEYSLAFDAAVAGGHAADRLGYAFAAGYSQALRRLVAGLSTPSDALRSHVALCITESGGNHPRAIQTAIHREGSKLLVSGQKSFVTFGSQARTLLLAVVDGEDEHKRPRIRVLVVPANRSGVQFQPIAQIPFVPEIPHAALTLQNVEIQPAELLEGDGYARYVKPFRTVEDIHVFGAVLGYALRLGRQMRCEAAIQERVLASVAALRQLADGPFDDPGLHVALAGVLAGANEVVGRVGELLAISASTSGTDSPVDAEVRARWDRDVALMYVAGRARAQRRVVAWQHLDEHAAL